MKRMLRKDARDNCAIHIAVLEAMAQEMVLHGSCHKQVALDKAGYSFAEEFVRWDYIREFLQEELQEEVLPVAQRFWKMTEQARIEKPEQALATGWGKKTAGFALVSWSPEMGRKWLQIIEGRRKGVTKQANKVAATMTKHNVPLVTDGSNLRDNGDLHELINPDQQALPMPS